MEKQEGGGSPVGDYSTVRYEFSLPQVFGTFGASGSFHQLPPLTKNLYSYLPGASRRVATHRSPAGSGVIGCAVTLQSLKSPTSVTDLAPGQRKLK